MADGKEVSLNYKVRRRDIDDYGYLNNARYSSLYEMGRQELQNMIGFNDGDITKRGLTQRYSKAHFDFETPIKKKWGIQVCASVTCEKVRLSYSYRVLYKGEVMATATAKSCLVNEETEKIIRIPGDIADKINSFNQSFK